MNIFGGNIIETIKLAPELITLNRMITNICYTSVAVLPLQQKQNASRLHFSAKANREAAIATGNTRKKITQIVFSIHRIDTIFADHRSASQFHL